MPQKQCPWCARYQAHVRADERAKTIAWVAERLRKEAKAISSELGKRESDYNTLDIEDFAEDFVEGLK